MYYNTTQSFKKGGLRLLEGSDSMSKINLNFLNLIHGFILKGKILKGKVNENELEKIEKINVVYYAIKFNNTEFQKRMFVSLSEEDKTYFIEQFNKRKIFFDASVMEQFYDDFVKISFKSGCDDYMIALLKLGLTDPLRYSAQINLIRGYFKGEKRDIMDELCPKALEMASDNATLINEHAEKNKKAEKMEDEARSDNEPVEEPPKENSVAPQKDNALKYFLKRIKRKLNLKLLLLRKKYDEIILWSNVDANLINELSVKDIENLFLYAKDIENYNANPILLDILHQLFEMVRPELQEEAIVYYHTHSLNYGDKEAMILYFDLFLKVSITHGFNDYIDQLAKIAVSDKEKYAQAIESIKEYVLNAPPSDDIVKIAGIEGIAVAKFMPKEEETIPSTDHQENEFTPDKTANYYNNADNNLKEQVLMSYLKGKPSLDAFLDFINKTNSLMEAYKTLPTIDEFSVAEKSEYLLAMYSINKDAVIRKSLIEDILYLNNYSTVKMLMLQLKTTEQTEIADDVARSNNYKLMLTLACTTKCSTTFLLITNIVMLKNTDCAVFLIANLKGRYLDYGLKMLLAISAEWYIDILRGLVDKPNHIEAIKYIFNNHFEHLFSETDLNNLRKRLIELDTRNSSGFGQHYS